MDSTQPTAASSYVYFIQHGGDGLGPVKIGTAVKPRHRLAELQTGNPERLYLQVVIVGGRQLEADLHKRFSDWRIRGEWFGGDGKAQIILAYGRGLAEEQADLTTEDGEPVEYLLGHHPISPKERLELRHDIERLWLRRFNPAEIAAEYERLWGVTEAEVRAELKEMRKESIWDVGRKRPGITYRGRNDAHVRRAA